MYVDPITLSNFFSWTKLEHLDDPTALLLLMTFPYYEHKWDLVGLLFDAVGLSHDNNGAMDMEAIKKDEENETDDGR